MEKRFENLRWVPRWVSHMGCVKGCLGFLGLGAQPPTPEWGLMLSRNKHHIFTSPWMVIFPGVAIMFLVLGFNLLGDGLRDALDPWLK